ncbi:hypothetical protein [Streptomyces sp. x-80]|uniref:hypothetical protein n=1 Tax=Streptomyces sp. x-80 TaxID=2789282 RepID=UPI00397F1EA4
MPPPAPAARARQRLPPTAWPYAAGQATRTPAGHHRSLTRAEQLVAEVREAVEG